MSIALLLDRVRPWSNKGLSSKSFGGTEETKMFTLDQVVPWGRSFREYERMFALTGDDLRRRILGCGDGPAAFNAEATRRGARVVSGDPLYRFSGEQVRGQIAATRD